MADLNDNRGNGSNNGNGNGGGTESARAAVERMLAQAPPAPKFIDSSQLLQEAREQFAIAGRFLSSPC